MAGVAMVAALLSPCLAFAGEPSIQAQASANTVAPNDRFTYQLTLQNADAGQLQEPNFGGLIVLGGPDKSEQTSFVMSGYQPQVTQTVVYSWTLAAPREGSYTIGAAKLAVGGKNVTSNSMAITCSSQAPQRPQRQRQRNPFSLFQDDPNDPFNGADPFAGMPGMMNSLGSNRQRGKLSDSDVFVRAVVDKTQAWLGEQITITVYAYSTTPLSGVENEALPKLDSFWLADDQAATHLVDQQRMVQNTLYHTYQLRQLTLFPLKAGDIVVDPFDASIGLGLSMFPGSTQESVKRKSAPTKITVKPLPSAGQPPGFEASNVGTYVLTEQMTTRSVSLGDSVTVKVTLEGLGNIKSARVPKLSLDPGLKSFDPTLTDKTHSSGGQYGGTKTYEWVIIPERTGDFTIPPILMPVFDPSKGEYVTVATPAQSLHVGAGSNPAPPLANGEIPRPVATNVLSGGTRPIHIVTDAKPPPVPLWKRTIFWPLATGPLFAWVLVFAGAFVRNTLRRRDPERLKEKRAHSAASKRLKAAQGLLEANDANGFHAEITRALQQFVADKTGIAAVGLTRDDLGKALSERGYPRPQVVALGHILEKCENARFAPGSSSRENLETLLDQAGRTLDALETTKRAEVA